MSQEYGRVMRTWSAVALAVLCLTTAGIAGWEAATDSVTIDEPVYVTAGSTALVRHDLRLNSQHPPLSKILAAGPVLAERPVLPAGPVWLHHHQRTYSKAYLEDLRRTGELREVTFLSRIVPILELLVTGLLVFLLARRLVGPWGGVFGATLWLLNPFVIGIGHLDGIDIPFTLMALTVALTLVRWLELRTPGRLVAVGLACGAALVTRDTGPLLLLVATLTVALASRQVRPVLAVLGLAAGVIWLVYFPLDPSFTINHPNLLPQRYIDGFDALADAHPGSTGVFMIGRHWHSTHWWIWPLSMVIKLPVTLLAAFAIAPFFFRKVGPEARRRVLLAVLPSAAVLAVFTMATPVFLGLRYMLPVIALMCVAVAPLVRAPRLLPILLVAGSVFFTATSVPHSIAWVAPPFHPGYRVTTDSNLDLGQDVYTLQRWARGKHPWIACYSPKGAGCEAGVPGARRLGKYPERRRVHGWVAISSTLMNLDGWDEWLRRFRPGGTINGTILLYKVP
jgi:dolichyl-phosphate-mannose-protein mannosyltransferase